MARWDRTPPGARRYVRVLLPALLIGLSSCNSDSPTEPVAEDGLELSATSVRFTYLGEEVRLQAVLTPRRSDGSAVVAWASTDASVVTVTQGGLARAVGNGSARITASVAGQFGVVDIQVEQEAVFMTLPADSVTLAGPGAREVLEVEVLDAGGTPLTTVAEVRWSSNREEIVTVDGSGMLNAVSPGDAIVTAEAAGIGGGGLRHEVAVRVNDAIRVDGSAMTVDALGGRSRLRLSSGAVAGEVFLTFEPAPTLPERPATISGTALQITPVALEFSAPVTLSIEYDEAAVPAGVDEGELALHQLIGDDFVEVEGALLDADANVASGEIDGLGVFAIVRRLSVATPALPSGVVGAAYGVQRLVVGGGSGTTWWSLAAGSGPTPPGLTLFSDGTVSGVPSEGGSWTFVVEARSGGQTARRSYTISVAAPLEIITDSLPDATPSAPYTTSLGAAGGTGSYSWSHDPAAGPLPPGLQLSGNGVLSGTPTQSGA